jgi:hypothetical protein
MTLLLRIERAFESLLFASRWLLGPIGNIPPAEAEERCCATLDEQKLAA